MRSRTGGEARWRGAAAGAVHAGLDAETARRRVRTAEADSVLESVAARPAPEALRPASHRDRRVDPADFRLKPGRRNWCTALTASPGPCRGIPHRPWWSTFYDIRRYGGTDLPAGGALRFTAGSLQCRGGHGAVSGAREPPGSHISGNAIALAPGADGRRDGPDLSGIRAPVYRARLPSGRVG